MRRWLVLPLVLIVLLGAIGVVRGTLPCGLLEQQPACYVVLRPGPAEDALELVRIEGAPAYGSSGELLLTTVAVDEQLGFSEWLRASVSDRVQAVPREQLFPAGSDREEVTAHNAALMADSQLTATVAALHALGREVRGNGARVVGVTEDAVTDELEVGEVITAVDGRPVADSQAVVEAVRTHAPGDTIQLRVTGEDAQQRTVAVTLGRDAQDPKRAQVGVLLSTALDLPYDVVIDAGVIGGPSAGLMFALSIVDLLGPEDLTGGVVVAGTGTVAADGTVGAVGGIRQKVLGATGRGAGQRTAQVFLVPRGNLEEARTAPAPAEVLLVPVGTVDEALSALAEVRAGRQPEGAVTLPGVPSQARGD